MRGSLEVRHEPSPDLRGVHQSSPSSSSARRVPVVQPCAAGRRPTSSGCSMRREPEALPQLGFGFSAWPCATSSREQPGAERQPRATGRASPSAVNASPARRAADHRVDAGARPGHEPEPTPHEASRLCSASAPRCRARRSRWAALRSARRCLRARRTSCFISKRIRLRVAGARPRRTPWARDAAFDRRVSREHDVGEGRRRRRRAGAGRAPARARAPVITNSAGGAHGGGARSRAASRRRRPQVVDRLAAGALERRAAAPRRAARSQARRAATRHEQTSSEPRPAASHTAWSLVTVPDPIARGSAAGSRSQRSLTAASAPSEVGW